MMFTNCSFPGSKVYDAVYFALIFLASNASSISTTFMATGKLPFTSMIIITGNFIPIKTGYSYIPQDFH